MPLSSILILGKGGVDLFEEALQLAYVFFRYEFHPVVILNDLHFLLRFELERFSDFFGYDDLKFG